MFVSIAGGSERSPKANGRGEPSRRSSKRARNYHPRHHDRPEVRGDHRASIRPFIGHPYREAKTRRTHVNETAHFTTLRSDLASLVVIGTYDADLTSASGFEEVPTLPVA